MPRRSQQRSTGPHVPDCPPSFFSRYHGSAACAPAVFLGHEGDAWSSRPELPGRVPAVPRRHRRRRSWRACTPASVARTPPSARGVFGCPCRVRNSPCSGASFQAATWDAHSAITIGPFAVGAMTLDQATVNDIAGELLAIPVPDGSSEANYFPRMLKALSLVALSGQLTQCGGQ